jgi:hypothetical protein
MIAGYAITGTLVHSAGGRVTRMWRRGAVVAFGFFVAICVAYVAGRIIVEMGLGNIWAGPMSAVAFAVAMMVLDRAGGGVG